MSSVVDWPTKPRLAPHQKYDWESWFDGKARLLECGVDFLVDTKRMQTMVYESAYRRGYKVRTRLEGVNIRIQAIGRRSVPFRCLSVEKQRALASGCYSTLKRVG